MIKVHPLIKKTVIVVLSVLALFIFFKYIFRILLPFIIAFCIAFILKTPVDILHKRTKLPKKLLSAVFVSITVFMLCFFTFLILNSVSNEIQRFFYSFSQNADAYVSDMINFFDNLSSKIPLVIFQKEELIATVSQTLKNMLSSVTAKIPSIAANIIALLPEILLFAVIIIMTSYYFCSDYHKNVNSIMAMLPQNVRDTLNCAKSRLAYTGISYLKSCLILVFITFFELIVAFLLLDVPYAFTFALIIAFVDMLPIFGVGTVLIPYAIYCKFMGNNYLALGILIVFVTVTVIRRFIEPRIISENIGLSPITTLFSMYVGFRIFGLTGLFFAPLCAILLLHLFDDKTAKNLGLKR